MGKNTYEWFKGKYTDFTIHFLQYVTINNSSEPLVGYSSSQDGCIVDFLKYPLL